MKILIIEDNKNLRENICFLLKKFNYLAEEAENWKEAIKKISASKYDAIVLDIEMPIMNWKQFLENIRKNWNTTPVIALTSYWMLEDKLQMFDLWVDDYMTKPFEIEELVARLKSILNRKSKTIDNKKIIRNIEINYTNNKISLNWETIKFPHKQYLIIELLSKNQGYHLNKTKIMEYVWWEAEECLDLKSTTLESHIYAIRKKLWKNFIKTVKWVGYVVDLT